MSFCGHNTTFCFLPPTPTFSQQNFSFLTPEPSIDRGLLRCRLCDLIDTQAAADEAEAIPSGQETEADIEQQISELKQTITEGVKTDTENALPRLQKRLNAAVKATDLRILEAWKAYWAVWGPGGGLDREDEFKDEGEDLGEIEIEFPPENETKPEVVAEVKVPAKVLVKTSSNSSRNTSCGRGKK